MSGKVLRINPENGRGVPSNPEYRPQQPDSVRSKIIAIGFRMPYRLTVDGATDEIYVGDVGTDQYEEIDLIPGTVPEPLNYGWPCYEGGDDGKPVRRYPDESYCVTNFFSATNEDTLTTSPAYAYSGEGGAAIVVGPQYAGEAYTDELDGKLVFADFIRDRFFTYDDGEVVDFGTPSDWGGPTDIAVTPRGTLAYTALLSGEVDEIVYLGGNEDSVLVRECFLGSSSHSVSVAWHLPSSTRLDDRERRRTRSPTRARWECVLAPDILSENEDAFEGKASELATTRRRLPGESKHEGFARRAWAACA